tara:strand:+ start:3448 stop:3891 length:444 start_codon:yes stop_codon:yes gene_type:complete
MKNKTNLYNVASNNPYLFETVKADTLLGAIKFCGFTSPIFVTEDEDDNDAPYSEYTVYCSACGERITIKVYDLSDDYFHEGNSTADDAAEYARQDAAEPVYEGDGESGPCEPIFPPTIREAYYYWYGHLRGIATGDGTKWQSYTKQF